MKTYQIDRTVFGDCLWEISDGNRSSIGQAAGNHEYDEYLAWVSQGNVAPIRDLRPTAEQAAVAEAKRKILELESSQHRAMREAVLTVLGAGNTKLHQLEAQIAAERAVIEANKGR